MFYKNKFLLVAMLLCVPTMVVPGGPVDAVRPAAEGTVVQYDPEIIRKGIEAQYGKCTREMLNRAHKGDAFFLEIKRDMLDCKIARVKQLELLRKSLKHSGRYVVANWFNHESLKELAAAAKAKDAEQLY